MYETVPKFLVALVAVFRANYLLWLAGFWMFGGLTTLLTVKEHSNAYIRNIKGRRNVLMFAKALLFGPFFFVYREDIKKRPD